MHGFMLGIFLYFVFFGGQRAHTHHQQAPQQLDTPPVRDTRPAVVNQRSASRSLADRMQGKF